MKNQPNHLLWVMVAKKGSSLGTWCRRRMRDDLKATMPPARTCSGRTVNMPHARAVINARAHHMGQRNRP